jgi:hypothetical protein
VDNEAVLRLKKGLEARDEVQQSLINYRKGGKPFMNLLTLIPVPWDGDEIRFYVGLQIDLVEQPGAIIQDREQSMRIDYRVTGMTQNVPLRPAPGRERLVIQDPPQSEGFRRWQTQTSWRQALQGLFDTSEVVISDSTDKAKAVKEDK